MKIHDSNLNEINPATAPADIWDTTTSATVVYEGYKSADQYRICKIDLTAETRTWAVGAWADRTTLTYK